MACQVVDQLCTRPREGGTDDDDAGDDISSSVSTEEDAESSASPPQDAERDVLLLRRSALSSSSDQQETHHVLVTPMPACSEEVVLYQARFSAGSARRGMQKLTSESVHDTPHHDDPGVDEFLAAVPPREPAGASAEHDQEDYGIADERAPHEEVGNALTKICERGGVS